MKNSLDIQKWKNKFIYQINESEDDEWNLDLDGEKWNENWDENTIVEITFIIDYPYYDEEDEWHYQKESPYGYLRVVEKVEIPFKIINWWTSFNNEDDEWWVQDYDSKELTDEKFTKFFNENIDDYINFYEVVKEKGKVIDSRKYWEKTDDGFNLESDGLVFDEDYFNDNQDQFVNFFIKIKE
jgi:hypothetical protein